MTPAVVSSVLQIVARIVEHLLTHADPVVAASALEHQARANAAAEAEMRRRFGP